MRARTNRVSEAKKKQGRDRVACMKFRLPGFKLAPNRPQAGGENQRTVATRSTKVSRATWNIVERTSTAQPIRSTTFGSVASRLDSPIGAACAIDVGLLKFTGSHPMTLDRRR